MDRPKKIFESQTTKLDASKKEHFWLLKKAAEPETDSETNFIISIEIKYLDFRFSPLAGTLKAIFNAGSHVLRGEV